MKSIGDSKIINLNNYKKNGFNIELNIKEDNVEEHNFNIYFHKNNIGFIKLTYIPNSFFEKYVYSEFNMIHFVNDFIQDTGITILEDEKVKLKINKKKFNIFMSQYKIKFDDISIDNINLTLNDYFFEDLNSYIQKVNKFYISNIYINKEYRNNGLGFFLFELAGYYAYKKNNRLYSDPDKRITNFIWRKFETEEKYDFSIDDYNLQSIINKRKPNLKVK